MADTIEDEPWLNELKRRSLYQRFRQSLVDPVETERAQDFVQCWPRLPEGDYGRLIEHYEAVLQAYESLDPAIRGPIRICAFDMVAGMQEVTPVEQRANIRFICDTMQDLEQYCHYVAGTVGIMATTLFEDYLTPTGFRANDAWREQGRRLGLGLQLTNIIKDCVTDAQRGISYIPSACVDLTDGHYRLYHIARSDLIGRCVGHLDAGFEYVSAIPSDERGIRSFLLGSMLPAIATMELAAAADDPSPKISRDTMQEILTVIDNHAHEDEVVKQWYDEHRRQTFASLANMPDGESA